MCGAIHPLPQYAFMTLCSVEKSTGATLPFYMQGAGIAQSV